MRRQPDSTLLVSFGERDRSLVGLQGDGPLHVGHGLGELGGGRDGRLLDLADDLESSRPARAAAESSTTSTTTTPPSC